MFFYYKTYIYIFIYFIFLKVFTTLVKLFHSHLNILDKSYTKKAHLIFY